MTGLDVDPGSAQPPAPDAPPLHIAQRVTSEPPTSPYLDDESAIVPLLESGVLMVKRAPAVAEYRTRRPLTEQELLHPWLVPAVAVVSTWLGRHVLHGGLVSDGHRALGLIGEREAGKSTLLAWLALSESMHVLADDLIVAEARQVHSGPRCIDLRPGALPLLPPGTTNAVVRGGTRLRLVVPPAPAQAQLAGFVVLSWGKATALESVAPADRLRALLPHTSVSGMPLGREGLLSLVSYPTWRLTRPRRAESFGECRDALEQLMRTR